MEKEHYKPEYNSYRKGLMYIGIVSIVCNIVSVTFFILLAHKIINAGF